MKSKLFTLIIFTSMSQLCTPQEVIALKSNTIGFSSQIEIDRSRLSTNDGNFGRGIQINVWYPAKIEKNSSKMVFSDYLKIRNDEIPNQDYKKTVEGYFEWLISQGANKSLIDSIMSIKLSMKAVKNGVFKSGKHPVILLMHGSAVDFAFLGESLAEQGYVP